MVLTLSSLRSAAGSRHRVKRIGRGNASGHGTTATRGTKGQRARQGGRKGLTQLGVKHFITRLPKVRGFRSFKQQPEAVRVGDLAQFSDGTTVTPKLLASKRLVTSASSLVKLIGSDKLAVKLTIEVHAASAGARAAVEAAGGELKLVSMSKAAPRSAESKS